MKVEKFKKGEMIIKEGTCGTLAYIINSGSVEVSTMVKNRRSVLGILGVNQIFGEMGLIEDKPRSATIICLEDTELRIISRESFKSLYAKDANVILPIVKALFERLRVSSKMISTTCEKCGYIRNSPIYGKCKDENSVVEDKRFVILSGANEMTKNELENKSIVIKEFPFKIGRFSFDSTLLAGGDVLTNNDLNIKEECPPYYVSKNHFSIDKVAGSIVIIDRGSRSGSIVNGEVVKDSCALQKVENEVIVGTSFSPFIFNIIIKGEAVIRSRDANDTEKAVNKPEEKKTFEKIV